MKECKRSNCERLAEPGARGMCEPHAYAALRKLVKALDGDHELTKREPARQGR